MQRWSKLAPIAAAVTLAFTAGTAPSTSPIVSTAAAASPSKGTTPDWARPASITTYEKLQLLSDTQLTDRMHELIFQTPYLDTPTSVRVLLPAPGLRVPGKRYPSLYLLHGCCDPAPQSRGWTVKGGAEEATAEDSMIVVMPEGGMGGFYSDWYNNGAGGNPRWESYIIGQLIPWIDGHYATSTDRSQRAIAGLSMGGYGALSLAARHPDTFVSASSFSGAVDSNAYLGASSTVDDVLGTQDGQFPDSVYGPRATEEVRWRGHNPVDLAENLRGMSLQIRTGNGLPGPLDTPDTLAGGSVETYVYPQNLNLHDRLNNLGITHLWDDYGPGTHSWAYWKRDLIDTLKTLRQVFAEPTALPDELSFTSVEPTFQAYGYVVRTTRKAAEFATLEGITANGFRLTGSGGATVTTAPRYKPGASYRISTVTSQGESNMTVQRADTRGNLTIALGLGPSNTVQQYQVHGLLRSSVTATVTISPV
ncbi:alpha/beta hydrolase [Pseudarthrobacter scleromae]|uniref:alpha/beta hydrolase n=1 Tax=Pseudarthrobacter scleromae TaxID=158897 RepID=UPI003D02D59D